MNEICEKIQNEENCPNIEISEKWKQKRRETFYLYLLHRYSIGLEHTMLLATLWYYVTSEMHSSNPHLIYGVICSGRFICPIFFGLFISRWFDIHRKLKCCAIVINLMIAAGYILYVVPILPMFPFAGNTLLSITFILNTLMNSEILRVYDNDEIQGQFSAVMFAYGLGETTGALCVTLLQKIDIWIGGIHIMYGNIPSLFLLGFTIIKLILTCFFVHDLSLEYDLKAHNVHSGQPESYSRSQLYTMYDAFGFDAYILLVAEFFESFCMALPGRLIPLIMQTLHYDYLGVNICFIGVSVSMMFASLTIKAMKPSGVGVYICGILGLVLILIIGVALLLIIQDLSNVINYILLAVFTVCYATGWICNKIFNVVTIGKLCHGSQQSLMESIRMLVEQIGGLLGSLTSAYIYQNLIYCSPVCFIIVAFLLVVMITRKKTLSDPRVRGNNLSLM